MDLKEQNYKNALSCAKYLQDIKLINKINNKYFSEKGIKPLFMTEDKVNIYNHEQTIYYIYTDKRIIIIN